MPEGRTHAWATTGLAAAAGLLSFYTFDLAGPHTLALAGGALAGLVLTPDLDVRSGCFSSAVVRRSAGRSAARLWRLFWLPYSRLVPHRSPLSHLPVLGTALRLLYLAILPALVYWISGGSLAGPVIPAWGWWAAAGLVLADSLHFLMDALS